MLRTARSHTPEGCLTLRFDPRRFPPKPAACYRASWQLPGPDLPRQAMTSLAPDHDIIDLRTGRTSLKTRWRLQNLVGLSLVRGTSRSSASRAARAPAAPRRPRREPLSASAWRTHWYAAPPGGCRGPWRYARSGDRIQHKTHRALAQLIRIFFGAGIRQKLTPGHPGLAWGSEPGLAGVAPAFILWPDHSQSYVDGPRSDVERPSAKRAGMPAWLASWARAARSGAPL